MAEAGATGAGAGQADTVSKADFEAAEARAQRFEGLLKTKEKELERFEKIKDIDPVRYKALEEEVSTYKLRDAGNDETKTKALIDEAVARERGVLAPKLEEKEKELSTVKQQVNHYKVILPAQQKLNETFLPSAVPDLQLIAERDLYLDGDTIKVKGPDGKPLRSVANPVKDMELDEWVGELAKTRDYAVKSKAVGGGREAGDRGDANGGSTITVEQFKAMTREQRLTLPPAVHRDLSAKALGMAPQVSTVKVR